MSSGLSGAIERARQYAEQRGLPLTERLGSGQDGIVLVLGKKTAIKVFLHQKQYESELGVYLRLLEHKIATVDDFKVPTLIQSNDRFMVLEMGIVQPPFVVDFAGAKLDRRPEWLNQGELEAKVAELFERPDRIEKVLAALAGFRRLGIFLTDVKPGNFMLGDEHLLE